MDNGIQIAQDRKSASINFFSATNNATAIYAALPATKRTGDPLTIIRQLRTELLNDYNEYHTSIVSKVGQAVTDKEVATIIERVSKTETVDGLQKLWMSLRQELRDSKDIRKAINIKKEDLKDGEVINYDD